MLWRVAKAEPAATFPILACTPAATEPAAMPLDVKPSRLGMPSRLEPALTTPPTAAQIPLWIRDVRLFIDAGQIILIMLFKVMIGGKNII